MTSRAATDDAALTAAALSVAAAIGVFGVVYGAVAEPVLGPFHRQLEPDLLAEFFRGFVLVLAVREQNRVGGDPRVVSGDFADVREPRSNRGPAVGSQSVDGTLRGRPSGCAGPC